MTELLDRVLVPPAGYRSNEAGLYVLMLDDQTRRLREAIADVTPDELAWQPVPGQNTIGMLLVHLALVEVYWIQCGPGGRTSDEADADYVRMLGITQDGDGMPLKADALPPAALVGKGLAYFDGLIDVARDHTKKVVREMTDADLERRFETPRARYTMRWVLYHILEHFSGHFGQILLLKHQVRAATTTVA